MSRKTRGRTEAGPPLSPLPPPLQPPQGLWRWALPALLLLYLGLALAHAWSVPTGNTGYQNAPDEAAHLVYVRTVAENHFLRLPNYAEAAKDPTGYEWHQPPLYYWLTACFLPLGPHGVRLASLLCGIVGILLIYQAGRLLFPDDPLLSIVAAGIAALTPGHIAITSTVNNDALLEVCFSAVQLLCISALRNGFTLWRAGWLGLLLSAAILTKATGLLLLPIAVLALILLWRQGETPEDLLMRAAWTGVIVLALCGWWFVRNYRLYGELMPLATFQKAFGGTVQAEDVISGKIGLPVDSWSSYAALVAAWTFRSFWAVYGTPRSALVGAPRFLPLQVYVILGVCCLISLAGLVRLHLHRKVDFTETQRLALWLLIATTGLVTLAFALFVRRYFQTQGRYLYPAFLPFSLLFALGWRALFPPRYRSLAGVLLLVLLAATSLAYLRIVMLG